MLTAISLGASAVTKGTLTATDTATSLISPNSVKGILDKDRSWLDKLLDAIPFLGTQRAGEKMMETSMTAGTTWTNWVTDSDALDTAREEYRE